MLAMLRRGIAWAVFRVFVCLFRLRVVVFVEFAVGFSCLGFFRRLVDLARVLGFRVSGWGISWACVGLRV